MMTLIYHTHCSILSYNNMDIRCFSICPSLYVFRYLFNLPVTKGNLMHKLKGVKSIFSSHLKIEAFKAIFLLSKVIF